DCCFNRHGIRIGQAEPFDDLHFLAVWNAASVLDVIAETDGLRNQRVAFPTSDGRAEKLRIRILRQLPSVGVDVANLRVGFNYDRDFTGSEKELHWIRLSHDSRHPRRQTIRGAV